MSGPSIVTEQLASSRARDGRFADSTLSDYWALTKPEVNFLILITTGVGFYLGCGSEARPFSFLGLFNTLLGTLLVASGTGTLNQYIERKFDAQMRRTSRRPLAAGRLEPSAVLAFGILLAVAGSIYLAIAAGMLASLLGASHATVLFVLVHTAKTQNTSVCSRRGLSWRDATIDRLGSSIGAIEYGGVAALRHPLPVAVPTFHGDRMDVPRRLRPSRLFGLAQRVMREFLS